MDKPRGSNVAKTTGRAGSQPLVEFTPPPPTPLTQHSLCGTLGWSQLLSTQPGGASTSTGFSESQLPHRCPPALVAPCSDPALVSPLRKRPMGGYPPRVPSWGTFAVEAPPPSAK